MKRIILYEGSKIDIRICDKEKQRLFLTEPRQIMDEFTSLRGEWWGFCGETFDYLGEKVEIWKKESNSKENS